MPTAYPGQPAYSSYHGSQEYGAGPVAWTAPENMSWDDLSVIESEEGVVESGVGGSVDTAFNPYATGISSILAGLWLARKEIAAQQDGSHDPGVKKLTWDEYLRAHETLSPRELILGGWEKDYAGALQPTLNPETKPGALGNENAPRSADIPAPAKDANISLWEVVQGRAQEVGDVFSEFKASGEALGSLIEPGSTSRTNVNTTILLGLGALLLLVVIIK